jgi:hypothetical protein
MAIECRHCGGTGTCTTGQDGVSCESCAGKAREGVFPFWPRKLSSLKGLPCGKCDGAGDLEKPRVVISVVNRACARNSNHCSRSFDLCGDSGD